MAPHCKVFPVRTHRIEARTYLEEVLFPAFRDPREAQVLFRYNLEYLVTADASVVLAYDADVLIAGANYVVDGGNDMHLQGVRVLPSFRGQQVGGQLCDQVKEQAKAGGHRFVKLEVRCDERGRPMPSPFSTYLGAGFKLDGPPVPVRVSGLHIDAHLGPPGSFFLVQPMRADLTPIAAMRPLGPQRLPEI